MSMSTLVYCCLMLLLRCRKSLPLLSLPLRFNSGLTTRKRVSKAANRKRRHVSSLPSWLEAWSLFAGTLASGNPSLAPQLFQYQLTISRATDAYKTSAWLKYDIQFRSGMAIDRSKRWDQVDPNIWALSFTGKARPVCNICNVAGHTATVCPRRSFRANFFWIRYRWSNKFQAYKPKRTTRCCDYQRRYANCHIRSLQGFQ